MHEKKSCAATKMSPTTVFPDFAVKQAFRELNIERDDDAIITMIQNELLTRCITMLLKTAIMHCVHAKRKYIAAADIEVALELCSIPRSAVLSKDTGYLLDMRQFGSMCTQHIDLIVDALVRFGVQVESVKISADTLILFQESVEQLIRGFLEFYADQGHASRKYDYRLFDRCMAELIGESCERTASHRSVASMLA